jgi:hypothetical protein
MSILEISLDKIEGSVTVRIKDPSYTSCETKVTADGSKSYYMSRAGSAADC